MEEQQGGEKRPTKAKGSFWMSERVCNLLIDQGTATQICAYLALARYTDETGMYSSAGRQAVKNALGMGDDQASRAIESLGNLIVRMPKQKGAKATVEKRVVYTAEQWKATSGEVLDRPTVKSQIRYVLDQVEMEGSEEEYNRVWFSNELVDGYGRFQQPLRKLKRLGDVAARVLLFIYRESQMEQFGGLPPYFTYRNYNTEAQKVGVDGYKLWHAEGDQTWVYHAMSLPVLRLAKLSSDDEEKGEQIQPFWDAISGLSAAGFIYEIVTVFDSKPSKDMNVIYELDAKSLHGYKPKGEEGLGGLTAKLAGFWGRPVTVAGRFHGTYAAVVEAGVTPFIAGVYRLRFRVANPKNHTVKASFVRISRGQNEWREILMQLLAGC